MREGVVDRMERSVEVRVGVTTGDVFLDLRLHITNSTLNKHHRPYLADRRVLQTLRPLRLAPDQARIDETTVACS